MPRVTIPGDFWTASSSYAAYEGFNFLPAEAVTKADPNLVEQITIPFWRQRIEFTFTCEGSDMEVVLAGGSGDLSGSWIDVERSDVDFDSSVTAGVYTRTFRLSFEANDLPDEQFRELTLRFRNTTDVTVYKEIKVRQIYLPNMLSRYSKANVAELNTFGAEITEDNFYTLTGSQRGYYYQLGRNLPLKDGGTYAADVTQINWSNADLLWTDNKFLTSDPLYLDQKAEDTWSDFVKKAANAGASNNYIGMNMNPSAVYPGETPYGDPCPPGWHLPSKPEHYAFAIGTKGTGSNDLYRFSGTYGPYNVNEGRVGGLAVRDRSGVRWDYWHKDYSRASYKSTGSFTNGDNETIRYSKFKPIYAVKFISADNYDVYENALKGAFKYEILDNSGNYYLKITYRHLGEYSEIINANDILSDSFWQEANVEYYSSILPLYGYFGGGTVAAAYNNSYGYYFSNGVRSIGTTPNMNVLRIGGPKNLHGSNPWNRYHAVSAEWSYSGIACMLRCIKNPQDPEIPATATTLPW